MEITGDKVVLRPLGENDKEMLLAMVRDSEVTKVTGGYSASRSCASQVRGFYALQNAAGHLPCIIADRENPRVGWGILILSHMDFDRGTAEIYIKLLKSARGKGHAQDAMNTMISYAFHELGLKHLCANIQEHNTVSRKLCEHCGFQRESLHQSRADSYGNQRNVYVYGITKGTSGWLRDDRQNM